MATRAGPALSADPQLATSASRNRIQVGQSILRNVVNPDSGASSWLLGSRNGACGPMRLRVESENNVTERGQFLAIQPNDNVTGALSFHLI